MKKSFVASLLFVNMLILVLSVGCGKNSDENTGFYQENNISPPQTGFLKEDDTGPKLVKTHPENGKSDVKVVRAAAALDFDENIERGKSFGKIAVFQIVNNNKQQRVSINVYIKNNRLHTEPYDWKKAAKYRLVVPFDAIVDLDGNTLDRNITLNWSMSKISGENPPNIPSVVGVNPRQNAEGVEVNAKLSISFSEDILKGPEFNSIALREIQANGKIGPNISINVSIVGKKLNINPKKVLKSNQSYQIVLPQKAVKNKTGKFLKSNFSSKFKTALQGNPPSPGDSAFNENAKKLLAEINLQRSNRNLSQLTLDTKLQCAADVHAKDIGPRRTCSHTGSDGSSPSDRASRCGTRWSGEIVACGQTSVKAAVQAWTNSPGHADIMYDPNQKRIGAAMVNNYWVVIFDR